MRGNKMVVARLAPHSLLRRATLEASRPRRRQGQTLGVGIFQWGALTGWVLATLRRRRGDVRPCESDGVLWTRKECASATLVRGAQESEARTSTYATTSGGSSRYPAAATG